MLSVSDLSHGGYSVREVHHRLKVHRGSEKRAVPPMRHIPYASKDKFTGGTVHKLCLCTPEQSVGCFGVYYFNKKHLKGDTIS